MFCPQCGSKNEEEAQRCAKCGYGLAEAARRLHESDQRTIGRPAVDADPYGSTMMNMPAMPAPGAFPGVPVAPAVPQPPAMPTFAPQPARPGGTMLGVAVPAAGSQPPPPGSQPPPPGSQPPPGPAPRQNGTMLGLAVPAPGSVVPGSQPPPAAPARPLGQGLGAFLSTITDRPHRSPTDTLADLVISRGTSLLDDRKLCEAMLWGEQARDINLMLLALDEGVPQQLLARAKNHGLDAQTVHLLAKGLADSRALPDDQALFAVAVWARALLPIAGRGG